MKREERNDNPENDPYDDLESRAAKAVFDNLSLEKKRRLIPELLRSAQIVHGLVLGPIEPRFTSWLCRGEKKFFTEEEALKIWEIWNLVMIIADSVQRETATANERSRDVFVFWFDLYREDRPADGFIRTHSFYDADKDTKETMAKKECFDWILDNTVPEQITLGEPAMGSFYSFPSLTCCHGCEMSVESLENQHGWVLPIHILRAQTLRQFEDSASRGS